VLTLLAGMFLARAKRFRAHGICQTFVVILNLAPITAFMLPAFRSGVMPGLAAHLGERFYAITTAHAILGFAAEVLGFYIALVAGTNLLPRSLRFSKYKRWMRAELVLWWVVIAFGGCTYWVWNVASVAATMAPATAVGTPAAADKPQHQTINITVSNFDFDPKDLQIDKGTTVVWKNTVGRHTVTADDGSFDSPIMAPRRGFQAHF
jgi:hypothetical protein